MEDIVLKAKEGDPEAFTALVREISPKLYKISCKYLCNEEDINAAIQETMYNAGKNLYQLKDSKKFEIWISKILKNNCLKILENENNNLLPLDENVINTYPMQSEQEQVEGNITFENLTKNLSKDEKQIINLKVNHQYKYKEISNKLNIPIKEIRKSYIKNIKKIKTKRLGGRNNG